MKVIQLFGSNAEGEDVELELRMEEPDVVQFWTNKPDSEFLFEFFWTYELREAFIEALGMFPRREDEGE